MIPYLTSRNREYCFGCGACRQACPLDAIRMVADREGFSYPVVDESRCNHCGMCIRVCPLSDTSHKIQGMNPPDVYAAWNNNEQVRAASSSGGIFSALADEILRREGVVFGAALDDQFNVRHDPACSREEYARFRGSKYVQSDINDTYRQARAALEKGRPVLFSGTPCQIAGLHGFLGRDHERLFAVDLICTGVPSPQVFAAYRDYLEANFRSRIISVRFRDKEAGWDVPTLRVEFADGQVCRGPLFTNIYTKYFFQHFSTRPSCGVCPYTKTQRESDVTIADFWGIEKRKPHLFSKKGVSVMLVNTEKGRGLFRSVRDSISFEECGIGDALHPRLRQPAQSPAPSIRDWFFRDLERGFACVSRRYLLYNAAMFLLKLRGKLRR